MGSEPAAPDPRLSAKRTLFNLPVAAWKALAAAVPVVAVFIAIWQTFLAPGGPPAARAARITEASASPDVSLRDYLNAAPAKLSTFLSRADAQDVTTAELESVLRSKGVTSTFSLDLKGPIGTIFEVTRNLFTSPGETRVPEAETSVVPPPRYVLHSSDEPFVDDTWIAYPAHSAGRYRVELVVLDTRGQVLAHKQTASFVIPSR